MFLYAANHPKKPIRIEMSAPQMYCAPFLGQPNRPRTHASKTLYSRYRWLPIYDFHKQYGETPITMSAESQQSALHKPPQRKALLKVDTTASTVDRIVPEIIRDEDPVYGFRLC